MRGNTIDLGQARRISSETFARWTRRLTPREGDLLLAREAPVGPVVRIPPGGNIAAGQRTMHLRADPNIVHPRYLYFLLISPEVQNRIALQSMGSTVAHLRVADAKALLLPPLPELHDQRAIAEVLGALDDKIDANDRIAATTKELLSTRFRGLRIDVEAGPGEAVALCELVTTNPKLPAPKSNPAVYLDMKSLPDRAMTVQSWGHREPRGGARFQNGDTLLARITPCLENGKVGFIDFLEPGDVGVGSTEYIVLRSNEGIPTALPYFLATSERFREFAIRHMAGTSGRQRLAAADLQDFKVRLPAPEALAEFGRLADSLLPRVKAAVDESRALTKTRDELLPLLMSGKIRVRDAERTVEEVV
nr:restriction endonuclease subunit S [Actinopolyspora xinjiangensis]